jgi:hypothetical protein
MKSWNPICPEAITDGENCLDFSIFGCTSWKLSDFGLTLVILHELQRFHTTPGGPGHRLIEDLQLPVILPAVRSEASAGQ